jgi:precorrin-2/cobalt-factor-2 C20-methyltransferase
LDQAENQTKTTGSLIGVGVGPGDPGMVTVRAAEVIRAAGVVAFPVHKKGASSRAFEAARPYISKKARLLPLLMPMVRDRDKLRQAHETAAAVIAEASGSSGDVVYLSLGDPLFYSTFGYLAERFPGPVTVVSGVTSMSAAAAAVGRPLASGDTATVVVTGSDQEGLSAALGIGAALVVIKPRSLSTATIDLLEQSGALERAAVAYELGGPREEVLMAPDREIIEALPYFSLLIIEPAGQADGPGTGGKS